MNSTRASVPTTTQTPRLIRPACPSPACSAAVGILVDRSPGVVVAMLGVLKVRGRLMAWAAGTDLCDTTTSPPPAKPRPACLRCLPPPASPSPRIFAPPCPHPLPKSGGFYVPLDPSYQADRLAGYIEDSKAPVIITQAVLVDQANELATAASVASGAAPPTVLLIEDILAGNVADVAGGKDVELPTLNDNDLCYCMFTSGSTVRSSTSSVPVMCLVVTWFVVPVAVVATACSHDGTSGSTARVWCLFGCRDSLLCVGVVVW